MKVVYVHCCTCMKINEAVLHVYNINTFNHQIPYITIQQILYQKYKQVFLICFNSILQLFNF